MRRRHSARKGPATFTEASFGQYYNPMASTNHGQIPIVGAAGYASYGGAHGEWTGAGPWNACNDTKQGFPTLCHEIAGGGAST